MEEAKKLKENVELIGKCFRYRNSSGDASWWLYGMVTGVDKRGRILAWNFEQFDKGYADGDECIQMWFEKHRHGMDDWEEISRYDFDIAWAKLFRRITNDSEYLLCGGIPCQPGKK